MNKSEGKYNDDSLTWKVRKEEQIVCVTFQT